MNWNLRLAKTKILDLTFTGLALATALSSVASASPIEVYFNHNNSSSFVDQTRGFNRNGDDFEKVLLKDLNSARSRIWLAVYSFDLEKTAAALIEAKNRGVDVRVMIDQARNEETSMTLGPINMGLTPQEGYYNSPAVLAMRRAGIKVRDNSQGEGGSGLMHHKFIVIDGDTVVTGSANFTHSDFHGDLNDKYTRGNANSMLVFDSGELNHLFSEEFQYLWGTGRGDSGKFGRAKPSRPLRSVMIGGSRVSVQFAPFVEDDSKQQYAMTTIDVIKLAIQNAKSSIDFSLFVFSDQVLADAMQERQERASVEIRGLIDPNFIYRDYSEALDMWGLALPNQNCEFEEDNNPWTRPIKTLGTSSLPSGDKLHHKFAVFDNSYVITGSHNWSEAAEQRNDETLLLIEDPAVAMAYEKEFIRLSAYNPNWGPSKKLLDSIKESESSCHRH